MAWTSPRTWNVGDKVTAALMNTHLRDNLQALYNVLSGAASAFGPSFTLNDGILGLSVNGGSLPRLTLDTNDYLEYDRGANVWRFRVGGTVVGMIDGAGNFTATKGVYSGPTGHLVAGGNMGGYPPPTTVDSKVYIGWNWGNGTRDGTFFINDSGPFYVYNKNGTTPVLILSVDATGKVGGKGFYDSGEIAIGPNGSALLAHGLGKRPRFVFGYQSATAGNVGNDINTVAMATPYSGTAIYLQQADATNIVVVNGSSGFTNYARVFAML